MEVSVKYHVDGKTFTTMQLAEEYIADNKDLIRISAFSDYLRANGQRGTTYMEDRISLFLKFEAGEDPLANETTSAPAETLVRDVEVETPAEVEEPAEEEEIYVDPAMAQVEESTEPEAAPTNSLFSRP